MASVTNYDAMFSDLPTKGGGTSTPTSNYDAMFDDLGPANKGKDPTFDSKDYLAQQENKKKAEYSSFGASLERAVKGMSWQHTLPAMMYQRRQDLNAATKQFQESGEYEKEVERRMAAGEKYNPGRMREWQLKRINEIVAERKGIDPKAPDASIGERWNTLKQGFADDPWGLAFGFITGAIENPEVFLGGPISTVAMVAGESALRQEVESGKVSGSQLLMDTATTAVPIAGAKVIGKVLPKKPIEQPDTPKVREAPTPQSQQSALLGRIPPAVAPSVELALDAGIARAAKTSHTTATPDSLAAAKDKVAEKVSKGATPGAALLSTLKEFGLSEQEAKPLSEAVDRRADAERTHEENQNADRHQGGSLLSKAEGKEGQGKRSEDMPKLDGAKPEDGKAPTKEEAQVAALLKEAPPFRPSPEHEFPALLRKYAAPATALGTAGVVASGIIPFNDEEKAMIGVVGLGMLEGFYSPLSEAVFKNNRFQFDKTGTLDKNVFLQRLDSFVQNGVLAGDEIKYTALKEFVNLSDERISLHDLRNFLNQNGVQIETKTLRSPPPLSPEDRARRARVMNAVVQGEHIGPEDMALAEEMLIGSGPDNTPKWGFYTLPGGNNYREILAKSPSRGMPFTHDIHYPGEEDYVAHARVDDRATVNGEKALHISEVQADLADESRKGGSLTPEASAKKRKLRAQIEQAAKRLNEIDAERATLDEEIHKEAAEALTDEFYQTMSLREELERDYHNIRGTSENAFAREENAQLLMAKMLLIEAAKQGKDLITWNTSEQNLDLMMPRKYREGGSAYRAEAQAAYEKMKPGMDRHYGTPTDGGAQFKLFAKAMKDLGLDAKHVTAEYKPEAIKEEGPNIGRQSGVRLTPEARLKILEGRHSLFKQRGASMVEILLPFAGAAVGATIAKAWNPDNPNLIAGLVAGGLVGLGAGHINALRDGTVHLFKLATEKETVNPREVYRRNMGIKAAFELNARRFRVSADQLMRLPLHEWLADKAMGGHKQEAIYKKVRDYLQGYRDVELTEPQMRAAEMIRDTMEDIAEQAVRAKILTPESVQEWRETYLTGLYDVSPKNLKEVVDKLAGKGAYGAGGDGMWPRSRFANKKILPDYRTAESIGLRPRTNNPAEIAEIYMRSMGHTFSVKSLIEDLRRTEGDLPRSDGRGNLPLVMEHTPLENRQTLYRVNAIRARALGVTQQVGTQWAKQDIQNAARDYVFMNHPALHGLKVHRAIAGPLRMLFDANQVMPFQRALLNLSLAGKTMFFAYSMFHPAALAMSTAASLAPRSLRPQEFLRVPRFLDNLVYSRQALHTAGEVHPWIEMLNQAGMTFIHTPEDIQYNILDQALARIQQWATPAQGASPVAHLVTWPARAPVMAVRELNKFFNHFLWDWAWPNLKVSLAMTEMQYAIERNLRRHLADPERNPLRDHMDIAREVAQAINDIDGGQNWFEMVNRADNKLARTLGQNLFSPTGRQFQQIIALSPDWNISAGRTWWEGAKTLRLPGMNKSLLAQVPKASDSVYRGYLLWSGVAYALLSQYIYAKFNPDANPWTPDNTGGTWYWNYPNPNGAWGIPLGDGRYVQTNKHFNEVLHFIADPEKFIVNKMSPVVSETMDQLAGREFFTKTGGPPMEGGLGIGARLEHAGRKFAPITAKNFWATPEGQANWELSFFGIQITAMTDLQKADEAAARAMKKGQDKGTTGVTEAERAYERVIKRQKRMREEAAAAAANRDILGRDKE